MAEPMKKKGYTCRDCGVPMVRGILLDRGHADRTSIPEWVENTPAPSLLRGLNTKGQRLRKVSTWRCPECGVLRSYAL